jgi:hypothetical protein
MSGPLPEKELRQAILGLAGAMTAASDQARAMTDRELGELLLSGRWTTIEVHEAGRRLQAATQDGEKAEEGAA